MQARRDARTRSGFQAAPRLPPVIGLVARGALDIILPPRTLDGAPADSAVQWSGLTPAAWSRIAFIEAPACDGCGLPFEYDRGPGARCESCGVRDRAVDRVRAACLYDDDASALILKLKHADRTDLAGLFARWIARAAGDILAEIDGVVPVPMHPWRLIGRRYNQSAEIARPLARRAGLDYLPDVLARRRSTGTQGGKSADARWRNVSGAFATVRGADALVRGRRLLIVDDVLTTGATVEGCARALKAAGAAGVDVAVIARVGELTRRPG